ncbi:MAG TPA: type II secretion system protein, partial [Verrucomicrobiae bacterium]|nr:type II secretion system protein [Verrucomicrobiae bacterium]
PVFPKSAFTLIELLVVIGILCLLASFMLPVLARAKIKSPAAGCLSNLRQMQLGWTMYKDDNNDILLPNETLFSPNNQAWCPISFEDWNVSTANTNSAAYTNTLLWPYVAGDINVYRCPGDVKPSANGIRIRSYSMNGQMGLIYFYKNRLSGPAAYDNPALVYVKTPDLTCPTPANAFIFCDESMCSLNDGYLQVDTHNGTFPDVPAAYHGGACGLGFADGHADLHPWQTTVLTGAPYVFGATSYNLSAGKLNVDWLWFSQHSACDHP